MKALAFWLLLALGGCQAQALSAEPTCSAPVVVETDDVGISAIECE
jgi:hypothetical protein